MKAKELTDDRATHYGHPRENFRRIAHLTSILDECPDPLAAVALQGILIKVARLIQSPDHLDSWNDIQGYARTGKMVMGLED